MLLGHYSDEGASCPGAQNESTFNKQRIFIFDDLDQAHDVVRNIKDVFKCRRNPRMELFSDNRTEVEFGLVSGGIINYRHGVVND